MPRYFHLLVILPLLYGSSMGGFGAPSEWFTDTTELIDSSAALPREERIELLGKYVRMATGKKPQRMTPEQADVSARAIRDLLAIPGHARYFEDKLQKARNATTDPWHDQDYLAVYDQVEATLQGLPSVETMETLGRLLENESDRVKPEDESKVNREAVDDRSGYFRPVSPSNMGVSILYGLRVRATSPYSNEKGMLFLKTWEDCRTWWSEIKSGKRAFSYGDENLEYRFVSGGGVVSKVIDPERKAAPVPPADKPVRRSEEPVQATAKTSAAERGAWPWVLASLGLAGGLAWMARRLSGRSSE